MNQALRLGAQEFGFRTSDVSYSASRSAIRDRSAGPRTHSGASSAGRTHTIRSWEEAQSVCLLVHGDGVRFAWCESFFLEDHEMDYLNAKFQAAGVVYRVHRVDLDGVVSDGEMTWPLRHGMIFDRDPAETRARLAAEALRPHP